MPLERIRKPVTPFLPLALPYPFKIVIPRFSGYLIMWNRLDNLCTALWITLSPALCRVCDSWNGWNVVNSVPHRPSLLCLIEDYSCLLCLIEDLSYVLYKSCLRSYRRLVLCLIQDSIMTIQFQLRWGGGGGLYQLRFFIAPSQIQKRGKLEINRGHILYS